jgi:hypothetical protein
MFSGLPSKVEPTATWPAFTRHQYLSGSRVEPEVLIYISALEQHFCTISVANPNFSVTTSQMEQLMTWSGVDDAQKIKVLLVLFQTVDFSHWTMSDHIVSYSVQLGITNQKSLVFFRCVVPVPKYKNFRFHSRHMVVLMVVEGE